MASDSPPTPGQKKIVRLGKYEVVQHIATGGMGAVYRARDTENNRSVALKILTPSMATTQAMVVRFRREYAAASKLRHENIVALYEMAEHNGTLYFAMEYVDGIDLHEHTRKQGTLAPEEARQIILQGARAIRHAASEGIVHRDIKPSNFLLTRKNGKLLVKLLDFGLAREMTADEFRVTRAGTTVGTLDYMAPEQARDSGSADIRSDLYALGSTWFHLLTGQSPFPDGGLGERLIKIMSELPPDVRDLNPQVSDETWAILSKLLAKDPDDRYQTPEELIDDLLTLEGKATARPRAEKKKSKKRIRVPPPEEEPADEPEPAAPGPLGSKAYLLLAAGALVLVAALVLIVSLPRRGQPKGEDHGSAPPVVTPPVVPVDGGKGTSPDKGGEKEGGRVIVPPKDIGKPVPPPRFPVLHRLVGEKAAEKLRQEIEAPWAKLTPPAGTPLKVRRLGGEPGWHHSLADAVAATPAGQPVVIEVHDNGPLFELPLSVSGRNLVIRAGRGYRPLLVWDVPAALNKRRADRKLDQPLAFITAKNAGVTLEGLEVAWRWPETLTETGTLLDVDQGELRLIGCTISASGGPREPLTLVRLRHERPGARCRLDRCQVRGGNLTVLDLTAPGPEVLLDGCLVVTTQSTALKFRGRERSPGGLRLVRSTLVTGRRLLELGPIERTETRPELKVLAWDSILSRSGGSGADGELFALEGGAGPEGVEWRSVGAVYAGWRSLLAGGRVVADLGEWRRQWLRLDGDAQARDPWPDGGLDDPSARPATAFAPTGPVLYAATVDADRPLGCDLSALPRCRDNWMALALGQLIAAPDVISDTLAPDVPRPADDLYHGGAVDLNTVPDLGAFLMALRETRKFGPRVVLHLAGKGEKATSPIRLKGSSLVLHFEEPGDKETQPLALKGNFAATGGPLIEVEGGGLEVIGGAVRCPDSPRSQLTCAVRVKGGDLRMYRTYVEGPQRSTPDEYRAAIQFVGSGQTGADRAAVCALNECVLLSSQQGLTVAGIGARVLLRQCLVVAGSESLGLQPGPDCKGEANQQVLLENTTFASRRAVVYLGDVGEDVPTGPIAVRSRDCAFLFPFQAKSNRAGMIRSEGESLSRGLLVWQSERDAHDARMHFSAWPTDAPVPDAKEPRGTWAALLGSAGLRSPRVELINLPVFDPKTWPLDRLILPLREPPGANLSRLGIQRKKP